MLFVLCLFVTTAAAADDKTSYFRSVTIDQGPFQGSVTCIFCDVVVRGDLQGDAVAIWGSITVNGKVQGEVVAVGGAISLKNGADASNVVAIGGMVSSESQSSAQSKKAFTSLPWIHLPGQRSVGWRGVVALLGFNIACTLLPTLILRPRAIRSVAKTSQRWFVTSACGILAVIIYSYFLVALDEYLHVSDTVESVFTFLFLAVLVLGIGGICFAIGDRLFPGLLFVSLGAGAIILTALELIPYLGLLAVIAATAWAVGSAIFSGLGFRGPRPPKLSRLGTELKLTH